MRMAFKNAGEFKNLCVEMQKTPVNKGVLSLLNSSKQVQYGLLAAVPILPGLIGDHLPGPFDPKDKKHAVARKKMLDARP